MHQTNLIQPHGALVLITGEDWEIIQVSENITSIIKEPAPQLIGQSLKQFLTTETIRNLQPIQPELGNFLLAFRPEVLKNVSWGGDPNQVITFEKNWSVYHPRHSFSIWQETVRNTATPWTPTELEASESLRNFLIEYTLNRLLK